MLRLHELQYRMILEIGDCFDVYQLVDYIEENTLFHFHENLNQECPAEKNIHYILDNKLLRIQAHYC